MPPYYRTPKLTPHLATDASDTAVGVVLQQHHNGTWHPISFCSKKMTPAETHYSTFDQELLVAYLAIKHFRHFLEGRQFMFLKITDHSLSHSTRAPFVTHPDKFISSDTFLNSPPLLSTSRELIMWLLTLFYVCILMLCYL